MAPCKGLLELAGIPYVGCGVLASSLAMDKIASKEVFIAHGLPVAPYRAVKRKRWEAAPAAVLADLEAHLGYPMFVKPANLGSSIGVSRAADRGRWCGARRGGPLRPQDPGGGSSRQPARDRVQRAGQR